MNDDKGGTPGVTVAPIDSDDDLEAVRALVREFFVYAQERDLMAKEAPGFSGLEDQLAALPGVYGPPGGVFLLARVDGLAAGCGAFFSHDETTCEVKRMYVRPAFRGLKIGGRLITGLIDHARSIGRKKIILNTFYKLERAQALYRRAGFEHCAPHEVVPPAYEGRTVFMERDL